MGKQKTTIILILSLLLALNGILFVNLATANPYMYYKQVSPPAGSKPLNIFVYSPFNNSVYNSSSVKITLNINNQDTSMTSLLDAYLKADWLQENATIYKQNTYSPEFPQSWNYTYTFSDIPEGEHNFTVYALGHGMYATNEGGLTANSYTMTAASKVRFRIDTVPPEISIISPINATYSTFDIPLNLTISENVPLITYSLDNQVNSTYHEKMTLSGLFEGNHNLIVYAWDNAGNVASSETLLFAIVEPSESFPVMPVAASLAIVAVASAGLLVHFKKHRQVKQG